MSKAISPKFGHSSENYDLRTIWHSMSLADNLDMTTQLYLKLEFFFFTFTFLQLFLLFYISFSLIFIAFEYFGVSFDCLLSIVLQPP